jgi:hypothetical protein
MGKAIVGARVEAWRTKTARENDRWVVHKVDTYRGTVLRCEFSDHDTEPSFTFLVMDDKGLLHLHSHVTVRVL